VITLNAIVGLRCLNHRGILGQQQGGEGPPGQPLAGRRRVRHRHQSQGGRGRCTAVPEQGILHRHTGNGCKRCRGPGTYTSYLAS